MDWSPNPEPPQNPWDAAPTSPRASVSYVLSGWWWRVGAVLVDDLILLLPMFLVAIAFHEYTVTHYVTVNGTIGTTDSAHDTWANGVLLLAYAAALMCRFGRRNGQTVGKQATHIRVVRNDGGPVDLMTVLMREGLGKSLPIVLITIPPVLSVLAAIYLFLDYLWPLWDRENRALHDHLARTHVIRLDNPPRQWSPSSA
ncbi:MAG TPA: RDD family protein [Solirubrobacteraceae bacterium]|jgi:uncharacterized RDD family membrane protein YckC